MPWWAPDRHADRKSALIRRGAIKRALRGHLENQGFTEVECGILAASPGNEAHLHAFASEMVGTDGRRSPVFLHTSPEFAAKKLLAAGEERIFEFARVFRNRERGPLHAPEFTMLEWYRANQSYGVVMQDCLDLLRLTAEAAGVEIFVFRDRRCDPHATPDRMSVADAFAFHAGIELLPTLSPDGAGERDALAARARRAGFDVNPDDSWADIFSKILAARVEPRLGLERPTILYEYPACEAALARRCAHDPRVAERFELYACGVELANGFGELTDPVEQRARFESEMTQMRRIYGAAYPIDEDFLAALAAMPPASGVALGFDRLVMLATHAPHIEQVLWTPAPTNNDA
jgi:lysyl-tRNA synthetase class 2